MKKTSHISERLIKKVARRFPGANMVRLPQKRPSEVVFEIFKDPQGQFGVAVAIIAKSKPHWHEKMWECYRVLEGTLEFFDSVHSKVPIILSPDATRIPGYAEDDSIKRRGFHVIFPGWHHWARAKGKPAIVLVISSPAWTPEDHHLS